MIVVDTSALMAIGAHEVEADQFLAAIEDSNEAAIGAPTFFEFALVAEGQRALAMNFGSRALLDALGIRVLPWDDRHAEIARDAFLRFGKGRHRARLNFGDCMSYAMAKSLDAPLLYKGSDFTLTDITSAI